MSYTECIHHPVSLVEPGFPLPTDTAALRNLPVSLYAQGLTTRNAQIRAADAHPGCTARGYLIDADGDGGRPAQATADMIIKAAGSAPRSRRGETNMPHIPSAITASGYCQM
jgi:hypothetical protein